MTTEWVVLQGSEETGRAIVEWLAQSVGKVGRKELDECVYILHCRGGSYRFSVRGFHPDQPDA